MNGPVFRDARRDDLEAVLRLYGQLNPDDVPTPTARIESLLNTILANEDLRLFVLERDGAVVATTYLNVIPNLTRGGAPYAVIENVVVDEHVRGQGYGKALMAFTLHSAWAAGCYKVMLLTGSSQESTHAFYRACGFSSTDKSAYVARPTTSPDA